MLRSSMMVMVSTELLLLADNFSFYLDKHTEARQSPVDVIENASSEFDRRQSHRFSLNFNHDEFILGRDGSFIGLEDVETENWGTWLAEVTPNSYPRAGSFVASQEIKSPPDGSSRDSLDRLHVEVFNNKETSDHEGISRDCCSICLESFQKGDVLTCLPCGQWFHSCCLDPWVEICGNCPNCRAEIVVPIEYTNADDDHAEVHYFHTYQNCDELNHEVQQYKSTDDHAQVHVCRMDRRYDELNHEVKQCKSTTSLTTVDKWG